MTIYLVRHGETDGNARRIVQLPEVPLSARGSGQAERLAARLASEGIAHILSSDLRRAEMTAEALGRSTGVRIELEPLLQERNFGDARGTPYAEMEVDLFAPDYAPPNGESWRVFHARVDRAWARIREVAAATSGHLAVVTHGLVCLSLTSRHLSLPSGEDPEITGFGNTSLTIAAADPPFAVTLLGCTAHLERDPEGGPAGGGIA